MNETYAAEPARSEIDTMTGPVVLEFGTEWCGYCKQIQPLLKNVFATHPQVKHFKIDDGPGRPLGRSFGIKLWPTLIFLRDGTELARIMRPGELKSVREALEQIDPL